MEVRIDGGRIQIDADGRVILSAEEFAKLATNARKFLGQLTLSSPGGGQYIPLPTVQTAGVRAALDAYHSSVVLEVRREDGLDDAFVLSMDTALGLAGDVLRLLKQVEDEGAAIKQ